MTEVRQPPSPPLERESTRAAGAAAGFGAAETSMFLLHHLEQVRGGSLNRQQRRRSFWQDWSWIAIGVLAVTAYVLLLFFDDGVAWSHRPLDALKVFGFPGYAEPGLGSAIARLIGALVMAFLLLRLVAEVLSSRLTELRARQRHDHAVVCGLGDTGLRSARSLRAAGFSVTGVDPNPEADTAQDARELGALVLGRNAAQVSALENARVEKASFVVCSGPDDATNARVASLAVGLLHSASRKRRPSIHVHIDDPDLAQLLRGPLASVGPTRLHFFNIANVWGRALVEHPAGPFAHPASTPTRVAVLGGSSLARAVVVGAARRWHDHARVAGSSERLEIALVAPNAADLCATLAERYPALPTYCDLVPVAHVLSPATPFDVATLSRNGAPTSEVGSLAAVYACLDDESANLALALEAEHRLSRDTPVFFPASVAAAALGPFMLGVGRICPVVLPEDADSIDLLHDEMHESISRQVHQAYLSTRAGAADFGAKPADRSWDELSEDARTSSRAHVDGMIEQLRAVWYDVEPLYNWDEPMTELSVPAIEAMAELEHLRWCKERGAAGWRYAPQPDPRRQLHDLLVPWPKLSEEAKDIDRGLVRERPLLLAKAGFRLVRDSARDALARRLHERYLERAGDGTTGANAVPWDELTDAAREHSRAAVDHIAIKLARVGREAVPAVFGALVADLFSDDEIEELAELEHERWVEERLAAGWRQGPPDDTGRVHPWLVPWYELTEAEKEKDRDVVRAIPELLGAVGYVAAKT